ncbi:MAG TPA: TnpV protein [Ruminococcus sp.]|nr:TnpV protein [Ruminococcus sp.]HCR74346.1 TnpV protein [Ruminococcus sp.]
MTYEKWKTLTQEEQKNVPDEELPVIPPELLENKLTEARAMRVDGQMGWETTQKVPNGKETMWFPEYRMKIVGKQEFWYKFDPICGLYSLNLTGLEPSMKEEPIGIYGLRWMDFMEENYPHLVEEMKLYHRYLTVARSVNRNAMEYRDLLDSQYEQMTPRPTDFEEILKWERARAFYSDSTVMRERVLVPVTEA